MPRSLVRALALVGAAALAAAGFTAGGGSAAGTSPHLFHVVDMNVECHASAVAAAVKRTVTTHSPVLGLQEVSEAEAESIARAHPSWTFAGHRDHPSPVCDYYATSGELAVYTGHSTDVRTGSYQFVHQITQGRGAPTASGMACVTWDKVNHFCSVHLAAYNQGVASQEAREVAYCTRTWVRAGDQVVVSGDFNAPPYSHFVDGRSVRDHTLDFMYRNNGRGQFYEADAAAVGPHKQRAGATTTDPGEARAEGIQPGQPRKIDYVFVDKDAWPGGNARSSRLKITDTGLSDHALLYSSSTLQGATSHRYTRSLCHTLH